MPVFSTNYYYFDCPIDFNYCLSPIPDTNTFNSCLLHHIIYPFLLIYK